MLISRVCEEFSIPPQQATTALGLDHLEPDDLMLCLLDYRSYQRARQHYDSTKDKLTLPTTGIFSLIDQFLYEDRQTHAHN